MQHPKRRPRADHVSRREMRLGRWGPVVFYAGNLALWFVTALAAGAGDLLGLALLPLPALLLYLWRTRRRPA